MKWTDLLKEEMKLPYDSAAAMMKLVDDKKLSWKPKTGKNWFTTGQLLLHLSSSCGTGCRGFVTGEWKDDSVSPEYHPEGASALPPAEKYLSAKSVQEALQRLEADRKLALEMIDRAGEDALENRRSAPPWGGPELSLGRHILMMIDHLKIHKAQLFYYLKLQGKPVHTGTLWSVG